MSTAGTKIAKAVASASPPPKPALTSAEPPHESRRYLIPMLGIVLAALVLVLNEYSRQPIIPGVDPAHWLTVSYGYVGLAYPADFTDAPLLYPPLMFPPLGGAVLLLGNPSNAGKLFASILLIGYGLAVIHLARRYLLTGPIQLLLVGLAIFNGTTIQILFWGGYPNFLGLIFMIEALVFLLAYLRSRSLWDAIGLYGFASLLYLTHDLTFAILVSTFVVTVIVLLLQDRRWLPYILSWPNVIGLAILAGTVLTYNLVTLAIGVPHPGYLSTNPAAYYIDNVGEIFRPLSFAPVFFPAGSGVVLDPRVTVGLLLGLAVGSIVVLQIVRYYRRSWVPTRLTIAVAWLAAAMALPALGYSAGIDTDYPRFVYFLPLPASVVLALVVERALQDRIRKTTTNSRSAARPTASETTDGLSRLPAVYVAPRRIAQIAVVFIVLLLFASVTVPAADLAESTYAGPAHSQGFLTAVNWLKNNPAPGAVLTDSTDSARWVQAYTTRDSFSSGLTYLHFYRQQILLDEESYLALNSHYAVSDNKAVLEYTGFGTQVPALQTLDELPLYAVYVQGVVFPILRIPLSSISLTVDNNLTDTMNTTKLAGPPMLNATPLPTAVVTFTDPNASLVETAQLLGNGTAQIQFLVVPAANHTVSGLQFSIRQPTPTPQAKTTSVYQRPVARGSNYFWSLSGHLGQYPGPYSVTTQIAPEPGSGFPFAPTLGAPLNASVLNPNASGSGPFTFSFALSTQGLSNPATVLPALWDTNSFLASYSIHFVVLAAYPPASSRTAVMLQSEMGFSMAYSQAGWFVLQR